MFFSPQKPFYAYSGMNLYGFIWKYFWPGSQCVKNIKTKMITKNIFHSPNSVIYSGIFFFTSKISHLHGIWLKIGEKDTFCNCIYVRFGSILLKLLVRENDNLISKTDQTHCCVNYTKIVAVWNIEMFWCAHLHDQSLKSLNNNIMYVMHS